MRRTEPCAAVAEQLLPQCALCVFRLVAAALGQLRYQHVGDILEIAGRDRKGDVEAVDVGLLEPILDLVSDAFGRADHDGAGAADADMLDDVTHGPDAVGVAAGDVVQCAATSIVLDVTHLLVELVAGEVDAGPSRH
ncbi:hypothetical protein ABIF67_003448 [Bradyrhizobium japonicum]